MNENKNSRLSIPLPTRQTLNRWLRWITPNGGTLILLALFLFAQSVGAIPLPAQNAAPAWPTAPTINYQGRLADSGGTPINDTLAMQFALYDSDGAGTLLWGPETHATVPVSDGLFSVGLGSQTAGGIPTSVLSGDVWLEITVDGETLSPREQLRAVPYAMQASVALTVPDGSIGTSQLADGAVTSRKVNLENGFEGGSPMTLTGSWQDIPGANTTISVDTNSNVIVYAVFDISTSSGATALGALFVDGNAINGGLQAIQHYDGRGTVGQVYHFSLEPGTHTLQLQARKFGSTGSASISHHTGFTWIAFAE